MPRSYWDFVAGEIGGGALFWLAISLTIIFFMYGFKHIVVRRQPFDAVAYAALSMSLFCFGTAMRAFLTWMHNRYELRGWDATEWAMTWPWFGASLVLNILGAGACIWVVSSWRWRKVVTLSVVYFAMLIPTALFFLV